MKLRQGSFRLLTAVAVVTLVSSSVAVSAWATEGSSASSSGGVVAAQAAGIACGVAHSEIVDDTGTYVCAPPGQDSNDASFPAWEATGLAPDDVTGGGRCAIDDLTTVVNGVEYICAHYPQGSPGYVWTDSAVFPQPGNLTMVQPGDSCTQDGAMATTFLDGLVNASIRCQVDMNDGQLEWGGGPRTPDPPPPANVFPAASTTTTTTVATPGAPARLIPTNCDRTLPAGTVVGMATSADGDGYWIASSTGFVANCGDAAGFR